MEMPKPRRWNDLRSKDTPLKEVFESFITHRHDLSPRTVEWYRWAFAGFLAWVKETTERDAQIADIEPGTVNSYIAYRRQAPNGSPHQGRSAWVMLRSFSHWLADQGIHHEHGDSVLRKVRQPRYKDEGRRALTDQEMWKVIDCASKGEQAARDRAIVIMLLGTGLRLSELIGVRLRDVNFQERSINIRATTSKSRHGREITMVPEVAKELDRYIHDYRNGRKDEDEPLFTTRSGWPMSKTAVGLIFRRLKGKTGIKDLCAHMCRHTWATNYRRAGSGDLFDLQAEGGWSDLRMVRRYSKGRPLEERRRAPSPFEAARRTRPERRSPQQAVGLRLVDTA